MKSLAVLILMSIFAVVLIVLVTTTLADALGRIPGCLSNIEDFVQPHYPSSPDGNPDDNSGWFSMLSFSPSQR